MLPAMSTGHESCGCEWGTNRCDPYPQQPKAPSERTICGVCSSTDVLFHINFNLFPSTVKSLYIYATIQRTHEEIWRCSNTDKLLMNLENQTSKFLRLVCPQARYRDECQNSFILVHYVFLWWSLSTNFLSGCTPVICFWICVRLTFGSKRSMRSLFSNNFIGQ